MFALSVRLNPSFFRIIAGIILIVALTPAITWVGHGTLLLVALLLAALALCWWIPDPWLHPRQEPVKYPATTKRPVVIDMPVTRLEGANPQTDTRREEPGGRL